MDYGHHTSLRLDPSIDIVFVIKGIYLYSKSITLTVADAAQSSSVQLQNAPFRTLTLKLGQEIGNKRSQNNRQYWFWPYGFHGLKVDVRISKKPI